MRHAPPADLNADGHFSIDGSAVMYDFGRILKVGGAAGYDDITSNANSYVIGIRTSLRDVWASAPLPSRWRSG